MEYELDRVNSKNKETLLEVWSIFQMITDEVLYKGIGDKEGEEWSNI
jgi:hypothetical protein